MEMMEDLAGPVGEATPLDTILEQDLNLDSYLEGEAVPVSEAELPPMPLVMPVPTVPTSQSGVAGMMYDMGAGGDSVSNHSNTGVEFSLSDSEDDLMSDDEELAAALEGGLSSTSEGIEGEGEGEDSDMLGEEEERSDEEEDEEDGEDDDNEDIESEDEGNSDEEGSESSEQEEVSKESGEDQDKNEEEDKSAEGVTEKVKCTENLMESGSKRPLDSSSTGTDLPKNKKRKRLHKDKKGKSKSRTKKPKKRKAAHNRKNIRGILKETELDAETVAAQNAEIERRKRLMELKNFIQDKRTQDNLENKPQDSRGSELKSLLQAELEAKKTSNEDIILLDSEDDKRIHASKPPQHIHHGTQDDVITLSSDDDEDVAMSQRSYLPQRSDIPQRSHMPPHMPPPMMSLGDYRPPPPEEEEVDEDDEPDDPNDSGFHINDEFNRPDVQGRVLINVKHPQEDPDVFLASQIARVIKPHQIGGIRFLYDNLVESLSRYRQSSGFGCILAHSMGLGKTIQLIAFIDVFLRETSAQTVLCIVPINTLQNWMAEFNTWLPDAFSENFKEGDRPRSCKIFILNDTHKTTSARAKVLEKWFSFGGVLMMGYEMYRLLCSRKAFYQTKPKKPKKSAKPEIIDLEEEDRNKLLLVDIQAALVRPGPDLVICDEGHRIKNSHAGISQSLKNIRTSTPVAHSPPSPIENVKGLRRRVVLTGYPLQNNLLEYWCMVDFVRPNYLGTKTEFCNMFERPIMNGQCQDSTPKDVRLMRQRAHVLHSLLEGFVQRRGHTVLKASLPEKQEVVFMVKMSPIQRALYKAFMDGIANGTLPSWETTNPLKAFSVCCKIWNHPDVLYKVLTRKRLSAAEDNDLDFDTESKANGESGKPKKKKRVNNLPSDESYGEKNVITYEWAEPIMQGYEEGRLENGGKLVILYELIEQALALGERILVFSQSLFTLNIIEEFFSKRKVPRPDTDEYWCRNKNYFRLDGATAGTDREKLINLFNSPKNDNVWLFLLSTRAGSLGINLIGANRVIVMDASWNPCHDCQAVCRIYRYGQNKSCYVYRLVTDNTLEKKIYERQISKQGMSDRVVDELNPDNFSRGQVESILHYEDKDFPILDMSGCEKHTDDEVLIQILRKHNYWITKMPFSHESLLIDKKELRLSKKEKRLAKQSYAMEKKLNVSYSRPSYAAYYPRPGSQGNHFDTRSSSPGGHVKPSRPVASVKPIMSTPHPMQSHILGPGGHSSFPLQQLVRPGVSVHQVITTTDIMLPGANTATNAGAMNKIAAGQNVLVIKTTKGVYIRTMDGKIFAVRSRVDQQNLQKDLSSGCVLNQRHVTPPTTTSSVSGNINPLLGMAKQVERTLPRNSSGAGGSSSMSSSLSSSSLLSNIYSGTTTVNNLLKKPNPASQPLAPTLPKPSSLSDLHFNRLNMSQPGTSSTNKGSDRVSQVSPQVPSQPPSQVVPSRPPQSSRQEGDMGGRSTPSMDTQSDSRDSSFSENSQQDMLLQDQRGLSAASQYQSLSPFSNMATTTARPSMFSNPMMHAPPDYPGYPPMPQMPQIPFPGYMGYPFPGYPYPIPPHMLMPQPGMPGSGGGGYLPPITSSRPVSQKTVNMNTLSGANVLNMSRSFPRSLDLTDPSDLMDSSPPPDMTASMSAMSGIAPDSLDSGE